MTMKMMNHGRLDRFVHSSEAAEVLAQEEAVAHVALELAEMLERSGFSQRQLANLVGVTEGRISQILSAESNPTIKTLAKIGHAFGRRLRVAFADTPLAAKGLNDRIPGYRSTTPLMFDVGVQPEAACTESCAA